VTASLLTACSGRGSVPSVAPSSATTTAKSRVSVSVAIKVPGAASTTRPQLRRRYGVAANTQSIQASVYTAGTARPATALATAAADIAAGSSNCGASDTQGDRTCSFAISAPTGDDDFVFTTYDGWNSSSSTVSGNAIGSGVALAQNIAAGSSPSIAVTLNGIPATITLATEPAAIHAIIPTTMTLDVIALDADDDVIVTNAYYDENGNPVTVNLNESMSAGSLTANPLNNALQFSGGTESASLTAPAPNGLQLTYNGNADDGGSPVYFIPSSSSTIPTLTNAQLPVIYPAFTSSSNDSALGDPNLDVTGAVHGGAVFTPGQNPLFIYTTQNGKVDYYNTGSPGVSDAPGGTASGYFGGLVDEQSSTLYFIAQNGLYDVPLGQLSSSAAGTACSSACPPGNASGLGYDSTNGYLYYTSGANLIQYSIAASTTQSASLGVVAAGGIAVDGSGNIYVVANGTTSELLKVSNDFPSPTISQASLSPFPDAQPFDVIEAGNGDIVVTDKYDGLLFVVNNGNSSWWYLPNGGVPWYVAPDPAQSNVVWFDYQSSGGQIGIGRLDVNSGAIATEAYTNGPTSGQPGALAVSNSGGIMMVFDGDDTLVQVQP
jgi:hypothetical protein